MKALLSFTQSNFESRALSKARVELAPPHLGALQEHELGEDRDSLDVEVHYVG